MRLSRRAGGEGGDGGRRARNLRPLREVGLENPFELTGVYEGHALTERSIEMSGTLPTRIRLFRRPILDEWAERGDETLEHLVKHVVIHEIGHHFGLSDDDMHALEDIAG